jgi:signal transduction histidine kinase
LLWVGSLAVMVPLVILLALQYRSLSTLEWSLPAARKDKMRSYLGTVGNTVAEYYKNTANHALNVPSSVFIGDNPERSDLSKAVLHFEKQCPKIARRLFIGLAGESSHTGSYVLVLFYNPAGDPKLQREPGSRDWKAAHAACASWLVYRLTGGIPESPVMTVDERDPETRVIVKPIVEESTRRVLGVAGMILDQQFFKEELLPAIINQTLPKSFPGDYAETAIALRDQSANILHSTHPGGEYQDEVATALDFVFTDWQLGIGMLHLTEEQWARRLFALNLSLSVVMTGLLITGLFLALRTASRQMKLSQMKSDFVSNVSHELRTPLASIRVFGELLRLGRVKEADKIREYGDYIETESRRLTQLINNILDFSKIESGRKTYKFEKTDITDIVAETVRTYQVRLSQSGFNVIFEAPKEPIEPVTVDSEAIAQACTNLLDNAVKYSGAAQDIHVTIERTEDQIAISVKDHGIGVPREEREKIFEKFYRVPTGLVHDVKGSGLGLSIVKHIVEAHRGCITVESKPGIGSTFTITLPLNGYDELAG